MTLIIFSGLLFGCGVTKTPSKTASGNANDSQALNNKNIGAVNTANANTAQEDPTLAAVRDSFVKLPPANPVADAKKQSLPGITLDVPGDWKLLKKITSGAMSYATFQSPGKESEAISVTIRREYAPEESDLQTAFYRIAKQKIYSKIVLSDVGTGTIGMLKMDLKEDSESHWVGWETFPPPDSNKSTVKRSVGFKFPKGTYAQHEQLLADILYSMKIEK